MRSKLVKKSDYPEGQKWCPKCKTFKILDLFQNDKTTTDTKSAYCRECKKNYSLVWKANSSTKYLLRQAKGNARKKNFEFSIDESDISIPEKCPVLDIPLSLDIGGDNSPSVDRIDSDKGYIKGNVRVISWRANNLKSNSKIWEMEQIIKYMKGLL
jgi:hypothetical protein